MLNACRRSRKELVSVSGYPYFSVASMVMRNERAVLRRLGWGGDSGVTEDGWALRRANAAAVALKALDRHFSKSSLG